MLFVCVSLIILRCASVFALPSTILTREQYQYPSSAQRLLLSPTAVLSAQSETSEKNIPSNSLDEEDLEIELVMGGLQSPTSMTFIGNRGDMLILEKHGEIIHFINENNTKKSILNFSAVDDRNERGLLGVAVIDATPVQSTAALTTASNSGEMVSTTGTRASNLGTLVSTSATATIPSSSLQRTFVFFYLTEASEEDETQALGNRIYRFEWDHTNKSLSNGMLLLDLPVLPGQNHNGGRSEEHTSELQSRQYLVCRLLLE